YYRDRVVLADISASDVVQAVGGCRHYLFKAISGNDRVNYKAARIHQCCFKLSFVFPQFELSYFACHDIHYPENNTLCKALVNQEASVATRIDEHAPERKVERSRFCLVFGKYAEHFAWALLHFDFGNTWSHASDVT